MGYSSSLLVVATPGTPPPSCSDVVRSSCVSSDEAPPSASHRPEASSQYFEWPFVRFSNVCKAVFEFYKVLVSRAQLLRAEVV